MKCRWVSKDKKTKFRIFSKLCKTKEYEDGAKLLFSTIKNRFYKQFFEAKKRGKKIAFVSDKLEHYRKGYKKYFRNVAILKFGVSIKQRKYGYKHNNNCVERDHQYSKDRIKNIRDFKDFESADEILDFFDIHYNFIDEQRLTKKSRKEERWVYKEKKWRTPAQRAGIKINLPKRQKLLYLVRYCMGIED